MIDQKLVRRFIMATTTISPKFQIVIPKEVRDKLHLSPRQRLQVVEKGGVITLVPEVPLKSLKGVLKGMSKTALREKKDRL
jgi:AbrB family looped-hinge helix DNA binding protein